MGSKHHHGTALTIPVRVRAPSHFARNPLLSRMLVRGTEG